MADFAELLLTDDETIVPKKQNNSNNPAAIKDSPNDPNDPKVTVNGNEGNIRGLKPVYPFIHQGPVSHMCICQEKPLILTLSQEDYKLCLWNYMLRNIQFVHIFTELPVSLAVNNTLIAHPITIPSPPL